MITSPSKANLKLSLLVMIEDTNSDTKSIAKVLSKEVINFQLSRGDK